MTKFQSLWASSDIQLSIEYKNQKNGRVVFELWTKQRGTFFNFQNSTELLLRPRWTWLWPVLLTVASPVKNSLITDLQDHPNHLLAFLWVNCKECYMAVRPHWVADCPSGTFSFSLSPWVPNHPGGTFYFGQSFQ